ncbi:MAG: DUF86 domain-containing protein [Planctomycetaceae bacterium]|nr:DUF86 domain-containing protein [Planctomycetaceae bacterium]
MSKRDPLILVEDVRMAIGKIERYIATMDHDQFLADDMRKDAVARNLEIIGEAVRQMPEDFKQAHTDVPWPQIAGLRNRIVHDYFGLDWEIIWHVLQNELPELKTRLPTAG